MWEYQREECCERRVLVGASLFCHCGTPFTDRYRREPCYHVLCAACSFGADPSDICPVSETTQLVHPNDSLHICTVKGCNRGFLNFPSLKLHADLDHSIEAESMVDFYSKTGDITIQFGDVHRITQEYPKDEEASHQQLEEEDEVTEDGSDSAITQPLIAAQKPSRITVTNEGKENYDDLEELM
ncbi:hypothetical protein X943_002617 [Babesia divergens]|uniref:C2H2-type domain-containing protein n=1 Tax=Babesia divergens TaxID=32595 RepID=A0AAD9LGX1_BABDI|nr:hypothetical protein X943_002617 [Babesia divergens]